jgi:serine/threonine protein kinase/TPR repeat protein
MPTAERYHQYQILRREDGSLWELGRGAMGITYKAFDTNLRFTVALKVINSAYLDSDTARQRFLREARAAAGLQHPNVAAVFNLGTEQDKFYYVMEFIDGETVDARVKRLGPLKPVEALNIALQVARALAVAAKQQLVHRDLKPTNLMLVDQEGESMVKVIDFGLAKVAKDSSEDSSTLTMGGFVGTPHFASPEQVEEGEVDIRSDIYSLGATLYFVLTGQSPFSGSLGQVMSQHLYKPLPMEPLAALPRSVVSLLQQMMEKDRNNRPQTPQDLQKIILACLEEIRASESRRAHKPDDQTSAFETLVFNPATGQPLAPGAILAENYKLISELPESPQGRRFLADDLRRQRRVSLLVLSPEFLSDGARLANLEEAVQRLRTAPHQMLREVYSFETAADCSFLVEEYVVGPSLLDLIRTRSVLSAPEVLRLLRLLAPLVDHATNYQLQHLDLTLVGIHLTPPASSESGTRQELLQRPLTAWNPFEAKVDAIDFSFLPSDSATWAGSMTRTGGASGGGLRSSCVRMLTLLAYELLGGPRTKLESTGQYTPIAALTQEGNLTLRRALVDECPSAGNLVEQLTAVIGTKGPAHPLSGTRAPLEPPPRVAQPRIPVDAPTKRKMTVTGLRLVLAIGLAALLAIGSYAIYQFIVRRPTAEIAALSVQSEPAGASIFLDGAPPSQPPGTFTHVGLGKHHLSASLNGYLPLTRDIQVREGMDTTIPVILVPIPPLFEIAALTVKTEPAGALVLLDGKPPQQPPGTFTHVGFGNHQLSASLDGYKPFVQDLQTHKGMDTTILVKLPPIDEIAKLTIETDPAGASVLLDGKPPQQPPGTFTQVHFGKRQLTASLDGYKPLAQDLEVRKGMDATVLLKLPPVDEIAKLTVETDPAGASVFLDGKPPQQPPGTFTQVHFGKRQLTASLDGYKPFVQDLEVRKGMDTTVLAKLPPIDAKLTVETDPTGASVLLDGIPPQQPPGTFTHVSFSKHQLTAFLFGHEPITRELQVREGMEPRVPVKLAKMDENSPQYLTAYVRFVQSLKTSGATNFAEHLEKLESIIDLLHNRTPPLSRDEFRLFYKKSIMDAASIDLDILPAVLLLGENAPNDSEAMKWFEYAVSRKKDPYAMMKLGRLYLRNGTSEDGLKKGFDLLVQAYEQGNLEAGAYEGDCLLNGLGTKRDLVKGEKIIRILANQNQVQAMVILGGLRQAQGDWALGQGLKAQADKLYSEAGQWWEKSAAKDNYYALAHLGQMYEKGQGGYVKSEEEAEKRYLEGISHGNPLSMFYYGLMLQKKPDRLSESETLIARAAAMGLATAVNWFREHHLPIPEKKTDDEVQ